MANTYTLISSATVGSGGTSSIDFTSIPSTYTDLCLVISARSAYSAVKDDILFKLNTATTNFSTRYLYANGSTNTQASSTYAAGYAGFAVGATATASTFSNNTLYISNYTSSSNKAFLVDTVNENSSTNAYMMLLAGLWANTSTINQITLYSANSANFAQYTTAYLYGIKNSQETKWLLLKYLAQA